MRCRYCNNDIKIVKNSKYQKVGCCLEGCLTYNLDYRTKQYRILVLGRDEEETNKRIKERIEKTQETLRESGYYDDKSNNPFSRDYWLKQGYSKEEVDIKLKTKAKKMGPILKENLVIMITNLTIHFQGNTGPIKGLVKLI